MGGKSIAALVAAVASVIVVIVFYTQLLYTNDASHVVVFQKPVTGTLSVMVDSGTAMRLGASYQEYKKQDNFDFEYRTDNNRAIPVQFNDGGKASVSGNVQWEMPLDSKNAIALHTLYGSQMSIDNNLIRNAVNRALTLTAPLMSSTESYAARRSDFLSMFADQLLNGIYLTRSYEDLAPDPVTGEKKTIRIVSIVKDKEGLPLRSEESPLKKFGIQIQTPSIDGFRYEQTVETQIQQQRANIMAIQTAQAEAKKAEQAKITAAANGEAEATTAKWAQEVIKAKEVTLAEQNAAVAQLNAGRDAAVAKVAADRDKAVAETAANRDKIVAETAAKRELDVATLQAEQADQYKTMQTRMGEGDAARRAAVLNADGALQAKLEAWTKSQEYWAAAFGNFKGSVVPTIVTGSGAPGNVTQANAATDFMALMGMKAAKDLALDMRVTATK